VSGGSPVVKNFTYDASGNLVCDGDYYYQYDGLNRLMQVSPRGTLAFDPHGVPTTGAPGAWLVSYTYDGLGRLVRKLSPWPGTPTLQRTEHFYYDGIRRVSETITDPLLTDGEEPVDMKGEDDVPTQQYSTVTDREYIWGPGSVDELVCQIYDSGARAYAILDIGGNVTGLVNATGGIIEQYVFDPYGQALLRETPGGQDPRNRIGHKGLFFDRLDADTTAPQLAPSAFGLYQNRNRTFAPRIGRFLQRDPNASGAPVLRTSAFLGRAIAVVIDNSPKRIYPDGQNTYAFLGGSPALRTDPSGLFMGGLIGAMLPQTAMDLYMDYNENAISTGSSMGSWMRGMFENYALGQMDEALWSQNWYRADDDYSGAVVMPARPPNAIVDGNTYTLPVARLRHHLATNKNFRAGRKWSIAFKSIFDRANMSMNNKANIMEIEDEVLAACHRTRARGGRTHHADAYHQWVHDRLSRAVGTLEGEQAASALRDELRRIEAAVRQNPRILLGEF
jgi:YD repeat-containing protein